MRINKLLEIEHKCCVTKNKENCDGEVDQYYGTDGGLAWLCKFHLNKSRHTMWDGPNPMSKKYYDEVYSKGLSTVIDDD